MRLPSFPTLLVVTNAALPGLLLALDLATGGGGANPQEFAIHATGILALVFLLLSLAVTPIRNLIGIGAVAPHRRTLGLAGFYYACLHTLAFVGFDKLFSLSRVAADVVKRPYITIGMTALLLLVPLAVTSTRTMTRKLGGKRWRALHRLAYVVPVLGVVHFYLLVKADTRTALWFGAVTAALLGYRVAAWLKRRRVVARKAGTC
jgi:sulfoxide reductase heme-binding subunit YedZ